MSLTDHDERLAQMHLAETRNEVSVDIGSGRCFAKRANPEIAVVFEAR